MTVTSVYELTPDVNTQPGIEQVSRFAFTPNGMYVYNAGSSTPTLRPVESIPQIQ